MDPSSQSEVVREAYGFRGREPSVVILARALAPWPVWIAMWSLLRPASDPLPLSFAVGALIAVAMTGMVARAADRSPIPRGAFALLALALVVDFALDRMIGPSCGHCATAGPPTGPAGLATGLVLYGAAVKLLRVDGLGPSSHAAVGIDVAAFAALTTVACTGIMPLELAVGPFVALRAAFGHDARLPRPRLTERRPLIAASTASAVVLLAPGSAFARAAHGTDGTAIAAIATVSALTGIAAAIALYAHGRRARSALSGVVSELRPGGIVLATDGGDRVHVVPSHPTPRGRIPTPATQLTFLDVEEVANGGTAYRDAPRLVRARLAWVGTADALARTLRSRAIRWIAWAGVTLAVCVRLWG